MSAEFVLFEKPTAELSDPLQAQTQKTLLRALRTKDLQEAAARFPELQELDISRDPWSAQGPALSLSFLRSVRNLRVLRADYQKFSDPEVLDEEGVLNSVQEISLRSCGALGECNWGRFSQLKSLHLSESELSGADPLGSLPQGLERLSLSKLGLRQADFLEQLPDVIELDLSENNLSRLPSLNHMGGLKKLLLRKNMLENLESLRSLRRLQELNVADNSLDNVEALENMRDLRRLNFARNRVREIKPLRDCDSLESVCLSLNPIYESDIEEVFRRSVRIEAD